MATVTIRVALLGGDAAQRARLASRLAPFGIEVASQCRIAAFRRSLAPPVDVLLVDLEQATDAEFNALDSVADERAEPMLFVESAQVHAGGLERVVEKLRAAVAAGTDVAHAASAHRPPRSASGGYPVWVLAASLGGPEMLKRFLGALPAAPEAAFIIAQHIGHGFTDILAQQLHRVSPVTVMAAAGGIAISAGRAFVAPALERFAIDDAERFRLIPGVVPEAHQAPCIDDIMQIVSQRFGARAGAIVFSGMGDDGSRGARRIASAGGTVWAQSFESCTIDSMPRAATATGVVTHRAPPEALARDLTALLRRRGVSHPPAQPA
jgi:chemosensory pili system protein ChpB (putative protein-glutamate methylesterase)